jgi:UDP-N-acetylglucosamine/UDP-N-acetylgalactosamine diphosphorylase
LFEVWDQLTPEERQVLIRQLESIDFQLLTRLVQQHIQTVAAPLEKRALKPAVLTRAPDPVENREEYEFCRNLGDYALSKREVLVVTAAGGGNLAPFSDPVGLLPVGPVTGKSVFQLHAEKILALNKQYRTSLSWNIFCHPDALEAVSGTFKEQGCFGLKSSTVTFTPQGLLPIVDRRGKILLAESGGIAMAPSGHGTILLHFMEEENLRALESAGLRHIFYHQVDNPLVRMADPLFLGLHINAGAEVSSKTVAKADPDECVGVFCRFDGSVGVVEYMELSSEDRDARLPDGTLAFSAANIGTHIYSVEFLRRMRDEGLHLPFHAIELKTPCRKKRNRVVYPTAPNSLGFRAFAFDAIPLAKRTVITEVKREEEFSPIKQYEGDNSLASARRDLSRLYTRWLEGASDQQEISSRAVEISPRFARDAEDLKNKDLPPLPEEGDILLGDGS